LAWFDVHLKGKKEQLRPNPVRIYLSGAERWLELERWPPPTQTQVYYLSRTEDGPGRLSGERPTQSSQGNCTSDTYYYDPADPTPNLGGPLLSNASGSYDNSELEARADVLTYATDPLEDHLDVIGSVKLTLFVTSSLPHSDFFGRLCDVHPDGRSMNICDGLIRLGPKDSNLQPHEPIQIELEMIPTAHRFLKGHCLRLQVSSGSHPRFARNLGTDEPIPTATRMESSEKAIFRDANYPSSLMLPVKGDGR
jgi:putative CocE/NonD family hydrolase